MLLTLAQWIQNTEFFTALRASAYVHPIVLALHLSAISLFGGMIVLTDLRLLGWALKNFPIAAVIDALRVPKRIGFLIAATFGVLLFCSKAEQYYYNVYFRTKLALFLLVAVHAVIFRKVYNGGAEPAVSTRAAACLSLLIWSGILVAGREIGYVLPQAGLHMALLER
jgi:hypothetical protein